MSSMARNQWYGTKRKTGYMRKRVFWSIVWANPMSASPPDNLLQPFQIESMAAQGRPVDPRTQEIL